MSVVGIVALSLIAGLFIALLIGTSAWLVYVGLQFRKTVTATSATLSSHRAEWTTALESLHTMLESHRNHFDAQVKSINGQRIGEAVAQFVQLIKEERLAAQRIERAAIVVKTFTESWLSEGARQDTAISEVDADGYAAAEPGERFVSRSRTASDDAAAIADESADVTIAGSPFDNPDRTP